MAAAIKRSVLPTQLIGLAELAELLGLHKSTLAQRRDTTPSGGWGSLPPVPAPIIELSCGPIWLLADVEPYAELSALSVEARRRIYLEPGRTGGTEVSPAARKLLSDWQTARD